MEARIVPSVDQAIWPRLAKLETSPEALRACLAAPDIDPRVIAALDGSAIRHFLISVEAESRHLTDHNSRGISVDTRELEIAGGQAGLFLDIACVDGTGHDAFDVVGYELASRLSTGLESAADVAARVLAKWRRFWGQTTQGMLSKPEQIGLLCELWFFYAWLLPAVGATEATRRWRGPFGARHDFEWQGHSVETKGTSVVRGIVHPINGIDQLANPESGQLCLHSVKVREEGGAELSLPLLVSQCRATLAVDEISLAAFELLLEAAHYSSLYEDEYAQLRVRIVEEGLYLVANDFPRLTPTELTGGTLAAGVDRVEYEINLSGFEHLRIASNWADVVEFLR